MKTMIQAAMTVLELDFSHQMYDPGLDGRPLAEDVQKAKQTITEEIRNLTMHGSNALIHGQEELGEIMMKQAKELEEFLHHRG